MYFINDEMLPDMAYQPNLYSTQKNVKSINTSTKELEQLIGVYLRMGLVIMSNQRSYWEYSLVTLRFHLYLLVKDLKLL